MNKDLSHLGSSPTTGTTEADVLDLIEYLLTEHEPKFEMFRGTGDSLAITVGDRGFTVTVSENEGGGVAETKNKSALNMAELRELADFCERHGLQYLAFESDEFKVTLSKSGDFPFSIEAEKT